MFLKLSFIDESKKLVFKEDYKNPANLRALVSKIKGYKDNEFSLVFIDMENEQITLKDEFDMSYFLSQKEDGRKYLELMVVEDKQPVEQEEEKEFIPIEEPVMIIQEHEEVDENQEESNNDYEVELKSEVVLPTNHVSNDEEEVKEEDNNEKTQDDVSEEKIEEKNDQAKDLETEEKKIPEKVTQKEFVGDLEIKEEIEKVDEKENEEIIEDGPVISEVKVEDKKEEDIKEEETKEEDTKDKKIKEEDKKDEDMNEELPFHRFFNTMFGNISKILKDKSLERKIHKKFDKFHKNISKKINKCNENKAIVAHRNIVCDGCNAHPIIGKRFNCMKCPDYDLCEKCEAQNIHNHPMIRLNTPVGRFHLNRLKNKVDRKPPVHRFPFPFIPFHGMEVDMRKGCEMDKKCKRTTCKRRRERSEDDIKAKRQMLDFMLGDSIEQKKKDELIEKFGHFNMVKFAKKVHKDIKA